MSWRCIRAFFAKLVGQKLTNVGKLESQISRISQSKSAKKEHDLFFANGSNGGVGSSGALQRLKRAAIWARRQASRRSRRYSWICRGRRPGFPSSLEFGATFSARLARASRRCSGLSARYEIKSRDMHSSTLFCLRQKSQNNTREMHSKL